MAVVYWAIQVRRESWATAILLGGQGWAAVLHLSSCSVVSMRVTHQLPGHQLPLCTPMHTTLVDATPRQLGANGR